MIRQQVIKKGERERDGAREAKRRRERVKGSVSE